MIPYFLVNGLQADNSCIAPLSLAPKWQERKYLPSVCQPSGSSVLLMPTEGGSQAWVLRYVSGHQLSIWSYHSPSGRESPVFLAKQSIQQFRSSEIKVKKGAAKVAPLDLKKCDRFLLMWNSPAAKSDVQFKWQIGPEQRSHSLTFHVLSQAVYRLEACNNLWALFVYYPLWGWEWWWWWWYLL